MCSIDRLSRIGSGKGRFFRRRSAGPSASSAGFTLVELILALGIMGITFTTFIYLREEAVDNVTEVIYEREKRRTAQELLERKLAESYSDELEDITGDVPGRPGWTWEWFRDVVQEGGEYMLEYTLVLSIVNEKDSDDNEETMELKCWVQPSDEELLYIMEEQELLMQGDFYDTGLGGNSGL